MTIRSTHGLIQERNGMVWLLFKGYTMFIEPSELDEITALLQAFQQERDMKQVKTDAKVAEGRKIRRKSGESGV